MVFPLTKLNKEGTLLNASNAYYSEEYAQRMCSLYLTDELSRDETGKIKKTYRLHASTGGAMIIQRKWHLRMKFIARSVAII